MGLSLVGLFTHFPLAEEADLSIHRSHVKAFVDIYGELSSASEFRYIHAENTASILLHDKRLDFCNYVRPGIMLYGYSSREPVDWLLPSLYVHTFVIDQRYLRAGDALGYGTDFSAPRDMSIAVLPIGYGDGLLRVRREVPVFINGHSYKIVSKIFMSHTFVEADESVNVGDEVEIYGDHIKIDSLTSMGVAANSEQMSPLHLRELMSALHVRELS
jgi:alanine racemase